MMNVVKKDGSGGLCYFFEMENGQVFKVVKSRTMSYDRYFMKVDHDKIFDMTFKHLLPKEIVKMLSMDLLELKTLESKEI